MTTNVSLDSLIANEFAFQINGEEVEGVFRIENFVTFQLSEDGERQKPAFEVSKMVQRDPENLFNTWLRETHEARNGSDRPVRDVTIVAVDDGVETRRWHVRGAWISGVRYSAFDSASFEMIAETYTIHYDDIEEEFPED